MSSASVEMASDESGGGWFVWLDLNESNVTNSSPHYQEDDVRWCYEEGRVEVCVRYVSGCCVILWSIVWSACV